MCAEKLKILHVIDSGGLYGAEMMLLHLAYEQRKAGVEAVIASIGEPKIKKKPLEQAAEMIGIPVKTFRMRPGFNLAGIKRVLGFCHGERFDVLHSHGYKGNIFFGFLPRRVRRVPVVATIHGWTSVSGISKMRLYEWLDARSLSFLDAVVVVNRNMLEIPALRRQSPEKLWVIDNGIPARMPDHLDIDPDISVFCKSGFIVGNIGRYSMEKGLNYLLEALALLVRQGLDIKGLLIGEGHLRQELIDIVSRLNLKERVMLAGYRHQAFRYFALMDVYVISSLTEGLPITLLEAMRAKVPVVATKVGGIPDVLENPKEGILVAPGHSRQLATAIRQLYENPEKARVMAEGAHRKFIAKYTSKNMSAEYLRLYKTLLEI